MSCRPSSLSPFVIKQLLVLLLFWVSTGIACCLPFSFIIHLFCFSTSLSLSSNHSLSLRFFYGWYNHTSPSGTSSRLLSLISHSFCHSRLRVTISCALLCSLYLISSQTSLSSHILTPSNSEHSLFACSKNAVHPYDILVLTTSIHHPNPPM